MEQVKTEPNMTEHGTTETAKAEPVKKNYYDEKPNLVGKKRSAWREQFNKSLGNFVVIAAGIAFYFLFYRLGTIFKGVAAALSALKPVLYGAAIGYLLTPFVNFYDKVIIEFLKKHTKIKRVNTVARIISIVFALAVLILVVFLVFNLLIPTLASNIQNAVYTVPPQIRRLANHIQEAAGDSRYKELIADLMKQGSTTLRDWLSNTLLPKTNEIMEQATASVIIVVKEVLYILIGMIVSIYILYNKEVYAAQAKKAAYALFSTNRATTYIHIGRKANDVFSGFILGKVVDSMIIGFLCFVGLSIIGIWYEIPFIPMISVVIGVTNIIPFFGPYLGAIPCALLVALTSPMKALVFVIFILILQQIDGNIIGPKILGNSTGLSSFWVIFAILLFGGLFSFVGMILGVPTFAVIYYLIQMTIDQKLEAKNLPTESVYYDPDSYVNEDGVYVPSFEGEPDGSMTPSGADDISDEGVEEQESILKKLRDRIKEKKEEGEE